MFFNQLIYNAFTSTDSNIVLDDTNWNYDNWN